MDDSNFPNNLPISPPLKPPHKFIGHWLVVALAIAVVVGYFVVSYTYALWPFENLAEPVPTQNPLPTLKDPTAGWQTYRNEEYGFEFKYPAPFEVSAINQIINKDPDVFDLHLDFPYDKLTSESRMLVFITVDRRKPIYSWEQVRDDLKCDDDSKMVFVINGGEGVFCYQKFALDSGWFRNYQYYIHLNSNNHFYYIKTYISPEDSMLNNKVELFDQILSTFRFTK